MPTQLSNIELDEVSLVDKPANEGAKILLFKRANPDRQKVDKRDRRRKVRQPSRTPFDKCVDDIRQRDRCSRLQALQKARLEHPKAFAAHQSEGAVSSTPVTKQVVKQDAVREWERFIREIAARDDISRTAAMRRAREERPDLFKAMRLVTGIEGI